MAITIKVGSEANAETQTTVKLNARKSLDGSIIIRDHAEVDIVVDSQNKTVAAYPKKDLHDDVYQAQDRFFDFLTKKGVIKRDSIASGNVFASMQAEIPDVMDEDVDATQMVLLSVANWLAEEKPITDAQRAYEQEWIDHFTDPDDANSTELGEVPHSEKKGTIDPQTVRRYLGGSLTGFYE